MTESNRRALRTTYQIIVALVTGIPLMLIGLPPDMATSTAAILIGAWTATVAKLINSLEDAGLIPAWLKR